jgi:serine/threonine protein kinase
MRAIGTSRGKSPSMPTPRGAVAFAVPCCQTEPMATSWIPKIGDEFAGYRLEEMIGHGGMSIVYRARHLTLERSVALKLLAPDLSDDPSFQERFIRESRLAAGLDHPNVIPIYEAGEDDGVFYIAMRYVPGSNLKALLQRNGPLDPAQTISVIGQIASALNAAHEMGLVHRDVKPANVLIVEGAGADGSHHVYLSDFGIAKQQASNVTRTGMFIGTAEYASPEQIEGKELDGRSDVYSLGCVLYQCLTGNPAYEKDSEVALIYAHLLEPPPSTRAVRPELSPAIDDVVAKALAKKPEDRFATARDLAVAVREALSQGSSSVPAAAPEIVAAAAPAVAPPAVAAPAVAASAVAQEVTPPPPGPPPPAPPSPSDPAREPAPQSSGPSRPMSRKRLGLAAALIAIAVAGAVLAGVQLGRGGKSEATPPTSGATPQTGPVAAVGLLAALMPTGIAAQCKTEQRPSYGAVQTELCRPPANAPTSYPQTFSFSFFRTQAALRRAYNAQKTSLVAGNCGGTRGQKQWIHLSTGKTGGLRVCGDDANGDSMIVWTHEKRGSTDHVDMLGVARASGRGANLFRSWWGAIKDNVGKCRPLLPSNVCLASVQRFEKSR